MKIKYKYSHFDISFISVAITLCLFTTSCQDKRQSIIEENSNKITEKLQEKHTLTWHEIKLNNLSFSIPTYIQLNESLSNSQKKVYLANDETIGITIDFATLPADQEGSEISDILPDITYFGQTIYEENKRLFDDFRLINTNYSKLGSHECIEVHQVSTKISGKNTEMNVKANFLIADPYYYSITFSYPRQSNADAEIIQQIKNSFKSHSKSKNLSSELVDFLDENTTINKYSKYDNQTNQAVGDIQNDYEKKSEYLENQPLSTKAEPFDGLQNFNNTLIKSIQIPNIDRNMKEIQVKINFNIEKDGSITNIKITGDAPTNLQYAVINALSLMPKWKPALHNGKQIKSTFVLPLTFKIN